MLTLYYLLSKSKNKSKLSAYKYYSTLKDNIRLNIKEGLRSKCRVCLQEGSVSIYNTDNTASILEALHVLGGIQVSENDDYPKFLCNVCHEFIKGAILFRNIAKKSEDILKQPIKEETVYLHSNDINDSDNDVYDSKLAEEWNNKALWKIKKEEKQIKSVPKVTCNICNKVINKSYYKEHMTMHDPDNKKYICDVCGKSFRLRCAYHNHSLRHRKDFPYKCQICPYKGKYSELLKTHMRTHTGDYRYMCTECPARFLFKSNLNSHMLKHKKPHLKCCACKRAFRTELLLQMHFKCHHLGIKEHVCNLCGKAFGNRNAVMKHQRSVHKREKLLCGKMPAYLEAEYQNQNQC